MSRHTEHVAFQFPDERSKVRHLICSITTADAPLLEDVDHLDLEDKDVIDDFEKNDTHLLVCGLVSK